MDFRKLYRRILPVSKEAFHTDSEQKKTELRALNEKLSDLQNIVSKALEKQTEYIELLQIQRDNLQQIENKTIKESENLQKVIESKTEEESIKLQQLIEEASLLIKKNTEPFGELNKCVNEQSEIIKGQMLANKKNEELLRDISIGINNARRYSMENSWSNVFHDTIVHSSWLKNCIFSPGRWAIGYPAMYAIYRVLDEFKPQSILELGLGQSTKLIAQYVEANYGVCHKVIENDKKWITFFKNGNKISERTEIIYKELSESQLNGKEHIRCYKDFSNQIYPGKYDFIFIDAPIGWDMKEYSRIDILSILPDCLSGSFVIIVDDSQRQGERNTIAEIEKKLDENNILYSEGRYAGEKETCLIASQNWSFLSSL